MKNRTAKAVLSELSQEECPVSIISRNPHMDVLVSEIFSANWVKVATGACMFGLDSAKWEARYFDAILQFQLEDSRVNSAKDATMARLSQET